MCIRDSTTTVDGGTVEATSVIITGLEPTTAYIVSVMALGDNGATYDDSDEATVDVTTGESSGITPGPAWNYSFLGSTTAVLGTDKTGGTGTLGGYAWTAAVSYTHLDVYKRQVEARTQPPAQQDTTGGGGAFLDDVVTSKTTDSLVYDLRNKTVYLYNEGDVTFQDMNLKADFMRINMDTKEIYAYGKPDSVDGKAVATHPVFTEGSASYTMDTITYNIASKKAKIKGVATQEGDGWLIGGSVKKMPDNTINIQHGKYTTCDETDHPHFYLSMTKAKVIPGKKVVTGPAYLVLEDVPLYFLAIPEGFFPISSGPKSGLLMPTFGEESVKGFFLRDLGYYFALSEHLSLIHI